MYETPSFRALVTFALMGLHLRAGVGPVSYGKTLRFGSAAGAGGGGLLGALLALALLALIVSVVVAGAVGALFGAVYVLTSPLSRVGRDIHDFVISLVFRLLAVFLSLIAVGVPTAIGIALYVRITQEDNSQYAFWLALAGIGTLAICAPFAWLCVRTARAEPLGGSSVYAWMLSATLCVVSPFVLVVRWSNTSTSALAPWLKFLAIVAGLGFFFVGLLVERTPDDWKSRFTPSRAMERLLWLVTPLAANAAAYFTVGV